jgi:type I restriction enzyme S subunit
MVNMGEIFAFDRISDQQMELVPLSDREMKVALLQEGDLLFARSSLKAEGTGKCSIVLAVPEVTTFESHIIRVRLDGDRADSRFYYYFFCSPYGRATVLSIAKQVGAAGLPGSKLAILRVPYPDHPTQKRLADVLTKYDDLIENNTRRISLLEQAARTLYEEWFVRLRFPGREHTRITAGVPAGWEKKVLGDLCEEVREQVSPADFEPGTPYIGLEHIPRRSITLAEWGSAADVTSMKHRYREGEILFGKIRCYFHKVGIAFTDGVTSSDAIVIRPASDELRPLVLMTVSSDHFVKNASQTAREGSKMPRADWKVMQQYPVPLPPQGILAAFNGTIEPIVKQLRVLSLQSRKAREARDLLLPRLTSGEIAV